MIILLVVLLAIAVTITIVGVLLSPRFHDPDMSSISYASRGARMARNQATRSVRRPRASIDARRMPVNRRTSMMRYEFGVERHTGAYNLGSLLNIRNIIAPRPGEQAPWLGIALILISLMVVVIFLGKDLLFHSPLLMATSWPDAAASSPPPANHTVAHPEFPGVIGASQALARINQLDPAQYSSSQEFNTWAYSTCSAASMTEVINAYDTYYHIGRQYRVTDILKVESGLGAITPALGLLEPTGIDRTVAHFNFKVTWLKNPSVDDVMKIANNGRPVIINFPPDRWSGGHLLVARGGNKDYVYLADSSSLNMQAMARKTFLKYWAGFAAVVTPTKQSA